MSPTASASPSTRVSDLAHRQTDSLSAADVVSAIQTAYYSDKRFHAAGRCDAVGAFCAAWAAGYGSLTRGLRAVVWLGNLGLAFGWANSLVGTVAMGREQIDAVEAGEQFGADFFHPFGEWPGQLGSYFVLLTALNFWLMQRGCFSLAQARMRTLVGEMGDSVATVHEYTRLAAWAARELAAYNAKSLYKRCRGDVWIALHSALQPLCDRAHTLEVTSHAHSTSLRERQVMCELATVPAIARVQKQLRSKRTWVHTEGEKADMRAPWMGCLRVAYGWLIGPFILLCGVGILCGASTGFYEAIHHQIYSALGHTGEWSIAAVSGILLFLKLYHILFSAMGVFYNSKADFQAALTKLVAEEREGGGAGSMKAPPTVSHADLVACFQRYCEDELMDLSHDCAVHKGARDLTLHCALQRGHMTVHQEEEDSKQGEQLTAAEAAGVRVLGVPHQTTMRPAAAGEEEE